MTAAREAFSDVNAMQKYCETRISNGDLDFDDWVYRTRDACKEFVLLTTEIGFEYESPRRPRTGMAWLYELVTKASS